MLWNFLISVAIAYAAVMALVYLFQSRLIFYPEVGREMVVSPQTYGLKFEPADIRTTDGESLSAWWLPADEARGTILFFHGNAGNISHRLDYLLLFNRLRFNTLILDYRGYGKSTGSPSEEGTYRDAEAAWDYLSKVAPGRPRFIVGHSLGGAIAVELARKHPEARGLVLEATLTSVQDMVEQSAWGFLPVGLILTQKFDALSKIGEVKMPVMIAHGTRDSIVPFQMGERLYEAAPAPKRFVKVEGAGHHNLSGPGFEAYRQALTELFGNR